WFTENSGNKIGRLTTAGTITEFPIPTPNSGPVGIGRGPNGSLWFTEWLAGRMANVTPGGTITEFAIPTSDTHPAWVTSAADGNVFFTENSGNRVARLALARAATSASANDFDGDLRA